ncbi:hypothetical protein C731_1147 [Mycolicibacterium hassiacum DSM 44199]|uniref:Uncharacterized protein n=1 Tax=Mycolicibacterium hassiacum (strain DSM 44199 / CIP 105218 / JCM 12690 / 3849) TaxID=1122247 RepID=K5BGP7_MYCHD|nr:hypothetical protein C731_1147 [Mycolicibacterium hassiacum DSM 44199]
MMIPNRLRGALPGEGRGPGAPVRRVGGRAVSWCFADFGGARRSGIMACWRG